jgi:hypothetical protein
MAFESAVKQGLTLSETPETSQTPVHSKWLPDLNEPETPKPTRKPKKS